MWAQLGVPADSPPPTSADGSKPTVTRRRLNAVNSLSAYRRRLLKELKEQVEDSLYSEEVYPIYSVLRTLMGYVNEQMMNFEDAVYAYSEGALMSQRRIMRCLAQKFAKCTFPAKLGQNSAPLSSKPAEAVSICSTNELETFLVWAAGCGDVVRLHAFQFISELLHRCLSRRKAQIANDKMFDSKSAILSRRTMSTAGFSNGAGAGGDGSRLQGKEETSGEANRIRSDVLNEMVICDKCTMEVSYHIDF
jgi:hypothetical protein